MISNPCPAGPIPAPGPRPSPARRRGRRAVRRPRRARSTPARASAGRWAGSGSLSATAMRELIRRPAVRTAGLGEHGDAARRPPRPSTLKPYQPSPNAATRRSAASLLPPTTTGTLARDRLRVHADPVEAHELARERADVVAPQRAQRGDVLGGAPPPAREGHAERRELLGRPADAHTERASPPESTSSVAACLAMTTGLCSGSSSTPVASWIRVVTAAAKVRVSSGSSQSASAGTAMRPSAEYGYRDACASSITTCSPDHSVANPCCSAPNATARMTSGRAPAPMPSACKPSRMSCPLAVSPP